MLNSEETSTLTNRSSCMPFGKYKYKTFDEISKITVERDGKVIQCGKQYLEWLSGQSFCRENLREAIKPYLGTPLKQN